jgi:flagellar basal-body rod modification protein FlgD
MTIDFSALTAASATPVIPAIPATSSSSTTSSTDPAAGSQDYFLKLLVAQMNNQDPLNPMDSSQMTSQLAQINTVQGIDKLSTQLDSLLGDVTSTQSLQASSLVGHNVLVPGSTIALANGQATGGINLSSNVDSLTVTIQDASGTVVKTENLGAQQAGVVDFVWDGTNNAGAAATAGAYTFSVAATSGGSPVVADTLSTGLISSVTPGTNGASVFVNGVGTVAMSQVKQIF